MLIYPYNHTTQRFWAGENRPDQVYKINLYTSFTLNLAAVTKAAAEVGCVQTATAFGYVQDAKLLAGVDTVQDGTGARFTASDVIWTATGGNIQGSWALVFNDSALDDPPVFALDFEGARVALDGQPFTIPWDPQGIAVVSVV